MNETTAITAADTTIRKTVFLAADKPKVWDFLTRADKLGRWFHPTDEDLAEGQPYTLRNALDGDRMCWGEVQVMHPHDYMRWSFTVGPMEGRMSTVEWQLDEAPGGTRLTLTHSGLPVGGEGYGLVLALDKGWHGFTGNLHDLAAAEDAGDYSATIVVDAKPEDAKAAILDQMDLWWSTRVERRDGGATIRFNSSHVTYDFAEGDSPLHLNWTCTDARMIIDGVDDETEWTGTRLLWRIAPLGSGSRITLIHEGLNTDLACLDVCTRGWGLFFETSLKAHLTGGTPTPETSS